MSDRELNVLLIDKEKNCIIVDLMQDEYNFIKNKVDLRLVKENKTRKELIKEVRNFLNLIKRLSKEKKFLKEELGDKNDAGIFKREKNTKVTRIC